MTAFVEFQERISMFGRTGRVMETITIPNCGKNRRVQIVEREAKKQYPHLTLNRIIAFNLNEDQRGNQ